MPSMQLTHDVVDNILTLNFSSCADDFKYFEIRIGKEGLPNTWISVITDQPVYKFYNLNSGEYTVYIDGKTKKNEFIGLKVTATVKSKTFNKLVAWLNR